MEKILGENGKIQIIDETGNILQEIKKDNHKEQESDYYEFNLKEQNQKKIIIKTSKPITEGILRFNITKAIR